MLLPQLAKGTHVYLYIERNGEAKVARARRRTRRFICHLQTSPSFPSTSAFPSSHLLELGHCSPSIITTMDASSMCDKDARTKAEREREERRQRRAAAAAAVAPLVNFSYLAAAPSSSGRNTRPRTQIYSCMSTHLHTYIYTHTHRNCPAAFSPANPYYTSRKAQLHRAATLPLPERT